MDGPNGSVYLHVIVDCCTREVTGWTLDLRTRAAEAIGCIETAVVGRDIVASQLTLGSDKGSQFTSRDFRKHLSAGGITHRRGGYRDPESQAFIESWFGQFKKRCAWRAEWESLDQARKEIAAYIDTYHRRPHSGAWLPHPRRGRRDLATRHREPTNTGDLNRQRRQGPRQVCPPVERSRTAQRLVPSPVSRRGVVHTLTKCDHYDTLCVRKSSGGRRRECVPPSSWRVPHTCWGDRVVQKHELSVVLSEFARTLVTDFPIQGILDHLVERIVAVLPVTAAGVTLIAPGMAPRYIAASNDAALRFERLQTEVGQGPCLLAYESGAEVAVPDLRADGRFPLFAAPAIAAGLAAVFTFPLRHGHDRLGALDLYRETPGPLDPRDLAAGQTLADVAAAYLLNAQARDDARDASDRLRGSSLYDSLTGLPNRVMLQQRLQHAAQRAQRSHAHAGVLFIDLDQFKLVNDTHGHQVGDQLLCAVAQRLSNLVRPGDTLARVYGDEFVFLCEDLRWDTDIEALATRVVDAFAAPFVLEGPEDLQLDVSASVGLAYAGVGETVSNQLIVDADTAMYQAKRKGGAVHQVIDLREARQTRERNDLLRDLKDAFASGSLDVAYQPIVRTLDGHVTGVEALLRWIDPNRGHIPTRTLVGVAEENGLIIQIGAWVLERACSDHGRWPRQHPDTPLDLSVNVSARQLLGPGFSGTVAAVLNRTSMDPASLVLEMTEGIFIDDAGRAMTVLSDLKALGVRLALDDFGTGYSSLSYLRDFPVDIVKIDQGFIADIGREPTGVAIIDAVTNLAHVLGLSVTAEGIETPLQRDEIITLGCENAQGFLYAWPMPSRELAAQLTDRLGKPLHLPSDGSFNA